jgi:hypothetical protein
MAHHATQFYRRGRDEMSFDCPSPPPVEQRINSGIGAPVPVAVLF